MCIVAWTWSACYSLGGVASANEKGKCACTREYGGWGRGYLKRTCCEPCRVGSRFTGKNMQSLPSQANLPPSTIGFPHAFCLFIYCMIIYLLTVHSQGPLWCKHDLKYLLFIKEIRSSDVRKHHLFNIYGRSLKCQYFVTVKVSQQRKFFRTEKHILLGFSKKTK